METIASDEKELHPAPVLRGVVINEDIEILFDEKETAPLLDINRIPSSHSIIIIRHNPA